VATTKKASPPTARKSAAKKAAAIDLGPENVPAPPLELLPSGDPALDAQVRELVGLETLDRAALQASFARRQALVGELRASLTPAKVVALAAYFRDPLGVGSSSVAPPWPPGANAAIMKKVQAAFDAVVATRVQRGFTYVALAEALVATHEGQRVVAHALARGLPDFVEGRVAWLLVTTPDEAPETTALFEQWLAAPLVSPPYQRFSNAVAFFFRRDPRSAYERFSPDFADAALADAATLKRAQLLCSAAVEWKDADPRWRALLLPLAQRDASWRSLAQGALLGLGVPSATLYATSGPSAPAVAEPTRPRARAKAPRFVRPAWAPEDEQRRALLTVLRDAGVGAKGEALLRPCVWLAFERAPRELALGSTRAGGLPDLPASTPWPTLEGNPMHFVLQLALDDLVGLAAARELPAAGLLSFFVLDHARGDQGHAEHGAVIFTKQSEALVRRGLPPGWEVEGERRLPYAECVVHRAPGWMLPRPEEEEVAATLSPAELDAYTDDAPGLASHLLGWRTHEGYSVMPRSQRLLLQLGSDEQLDAEYGDAQDVAFFVQGEALARGDFASVTVMPSEG
jgi:hypothetical protein